MSIATCASSDTRTGFLYACLYVYMFHVKRICNSTIYYILLLLVRTICSRRSCTPPGYGAMSWLPELYSRLPVGRQSAGSWLSRASYGFVKTFLCVRVWLRLYIQYRAFAMFPVCKDSLLSSYRWCAGW